MPARELSDRTLIRLVQSCWPSSRCSRSCDAALAQGTRLLRRPAVSRELVAFEYGGDLWTVSRSGGQARRLTSTPQRRDRSAVLA